MYRFKSSSFSSASIFIVCEKTPSFQLNLSCPTSSNADRERWDDLINSYFEAQRHHTLLVQLIDCRHAPSADDIQMLHYLHYHNIPFVVALTKADKLKKSQLAQTQEEFEKLCLPYGCQKVVLTSGESGYGIPELQAVLNAAVAAEYESNAEDAE